MPSILRSTIKEAFELLTKFDTFSERNLNTIHHHQLSLACGYRKYLIAILSFPNPVTVTTKVLVYRHSPLSLLTEWLTIDNLTLKTYL